MPLARNTTATAPISASRSTGDKGKWHWTVTGNADLAAQHHRHRPRRCRLPARPRARNDHAPADLTATANGNLFKLPAGDASAHRPRRRRAPSIWTATGDRAGVGTANSLGRTSGTAAVNLDLPISRRNRDFSALGNLTLNANAEVDQLSDFGTLTTVRRAAPTGRRSTGSTSSPAGPARKARRRINQLGDPVLETPGTRIFDFTTGETVLVDRDHRRQPGPRCRPAHGVQARRQLAAVRKIDLRLRADYVHSTIDRPISSITGPTPAIEAAFPERFVRDVRPGQLVSVDLRPVNFDSATRDTLRVGLRFHQAAEIRAAVAIGDRPDPRAVPRGSGGAAAAPRRRERATGNAPQGTPPTDARLRPAARGCRRSASSAAEGGGGGGGGGGRPWRLWRRRRRRRVLRRRQPRPAAILAHRHHHPRRQGLDRPRPAGARLSPWRRRRVGRRHARATRSRRRPAGPTTASARGSAPIGGAGRRSTRCSGDNLHFSPLATFDLGCSPISATCPSSRSSIRGCAALRSGSRSTTCSTARPKVHDAAGIVPPSYQPDLLDPLGRTIMISFRKLFSPPRELLPPRDAAAASAGSRRAIPHLRRNVL